MKEGLAATNCSIEVMQSHQRGIETVFLPDALTQIISRFKVSGPRKAAQIKEYR
jgi:hypothetical protein